MATRKPAKRKSANSKSAKAKAKPKATRARKSAEENIEALKRRASELTGGEMQVFTPDDDPEREALPVETEEAFWNYIVEYEEAPWTTNFQQLENAGVSLPEPESLSDEQLTAKLWEVIHKLALLHVYIEQTDHLSDRELYTHLWNESLREETKALGLHPGSAWHIQPLGGCSEEDMVLYLKYYADEDYRRQWKKDWPKDPIPPHEDPPYDRDRLLPKPNYDESTELN